MQDVKKGLNMNVGEKSAIRLWLCLLWGGIILGYKSEKILKRESLGL